MSKVFSFNREFDFVRLDGLRRATGRPPHEWDFYIIKELLDNALDADEALWHVDREQFPRINISIEYVPVPQLRSQQLFVEVSNRAVFPAEHIHDIFDTMWYTSRKAFIKGLTRGALGNALKTLLGIPYALRNRVAGDWNPALKPLSIRCQDKEYLPQYNIDSLTQTVEVIYEKRTRRVIDGTFIRLGLDHFEQEKPRMRADIELLAQHYHLCNPHAHFSWTVVINGEEWTQTFKPNPSWANKFSNTAPIHWYSLTAFQDVIGVLYRKHHTMTKNEQIPLESLYQYFVSPDIATAKKIKHKFGRESISVSEIEGPSVTTLYSTLLQYSPRFNTSQLGAIGASHIRTIITNVVPVDGEVFYARKTSDDPDVPFVIEAAVASLKAGKRQLWTAINFSPTYGDPFQSRFLRTALQPDEPVLGLRGLLDAYEYLEETPMVFFFHLICPNVEHHEFSKTEINHLPFKQTVSEIIDTLMTNLRQAQEDEELQIEGTIKQILEAILKEVDKNERFVIDQLLEKLRVQLQNNPTYAIWLTRPSATARLQMYTAAYLSSNAVLAQYIAHPALGIMTIPLHPKQHFVLPVEHISHDMFAKHHVNKILYIEERELESVVIENKWLSRMDMALLHNPQTADGLRSVVIQCAMKSDLPIMVWHNANSIGQSITQQMRSWLHEYLPDTDRIIDLGLSPGPIQPSRLIAMMPREQIDWLQQQLKELNIPVKALPPDEDIRKDISRRLENLFFGQLVEHLRLDMVRSFTQLDRQLQITDAMIGKELDIVVKHRLLETECTESYDTVLEEVVEEFFKEIIVRHSLTIQQFVHHLHVLQNQDKQ